MTSYLQVLIFADIPYSFQVLLFDWNQDLLFLLHQITIYYHSSKVYVLYNATQLPHEMWTLSPIYSWYSQEPNQNALFQGKWVLFIGVCQQLLAQLLALRESCTPYTYLSQIIANEYEYWLLSTEICWTNCRGGSRIWSGGGPRSWPA